MSGGITLKNFIKDSQQRNEQYKIAVPLFNQIKEMKDNGRTSDLEYKVKLKDFTDLFKSMSGLENKIKNKYGDLKSGKELGKRKGDKTKFEAQYKEAIEWVDKNVKYYIPAHKGGGIKWAENKEKLDFFLKGSTEFDVINVGTSQESKEEMEMAGGEGMVKTKEQREEIEKVKLAKEAQKRKEMDEQMKAQIPEYKPEGGEEEQENTGVDSRIDLDKEEEIKTNNRQAVIDNHESPTAKPTLNPDEIELNQAQLNQLAQNLAEEAVGEAMVELNIEKERVQMGEEERRGRENTQREEDIRKDEEFKMVRDFEKAQLEEEARIGNLQPTQKRFLKDAIPTYEQEIPRGGESFGTPSVPMIADSVDMTKSIETLKAEIRALHLIYDSKIPEFRSNPHTKSKNDALNSKDLKKVREHHKSMMMKVKEYFSTGGLKLGVIIDAQSYLNNQFSGVLSQIPLNPLQQEGQPIKADRTSFERGGIAKRQINFKQTYIRGGMAHAKGEPIRNRIPSYNPHKTGIKYRIPEPVIQTNTIRPETIKRSRNIAYKNINFKTRK